MCSLSETCVNAKNPPIRSKKHMANVRKVSYTRTFPKITAQVAVPENLYEEPPDLQNDDMNHHRYSSPAVPKMSETGNFGFPSDTITKATSIQLTPKTTTAKDRKNSKLQVTPGDSLVSTTSLIMAGSPYLESKFLEGNRSLEDLYIRSREYPFDNLVFEGGGSKGMAYVGALQV